MNCIEKVQRRATKLVSGIQHLTYGERLARCKLPSMKYRRKRGDMIQVYKIINGLDDLKKEEFWNFDVDNRTRGHSLKIRQRRFRLEVRRNVFGTRIIGEWNCLPQSVVNSKTLEDFKINLDEHWIKFKYLY